MNADMNNIEQINSKIAEVWDNNVLTRAKDLETGSDYSYTKIIKPWVCDMVSKYTKEESYILDIGCGCGYLANAIYETKRHNIKGLDLSSTSIFYAQNRYPHISFVQEDIYSVSLEHKYNMCLAVMVVNNMPDLKLFFQSIRNILKQNGIVTLVIPHPYFWSLKHLDLKSFSYVKECAYLFEFSTKGRKDYSAKVTYYHRSLEQYINIICNVGYKILYCKELMEMDKDSTPDILGLIIQKC